MPKLPKTPNLTLVSPQANALAPPATLGQSGATFWQSIQSEYRIDDAAGRAILTQICGAHDTISMCDEVIGRDGLTVRSKAGALREHPLLKVQAACRGLIIRGLAKLNLDVEPTRSTVGRPPGYRP
jgi:hypothetical protein